MAYLSNTEVRALIDATESKRDRLLLTMCYEHALRISECLALTPARVQRGHLLTHPGKNGKMTVQKMTPATLALWSEMTKTLDKKTLVFPISRQWASELFHRAAAKAQIELSPRQGVHSLRHSAAHQLLKCGASLPTVQRKLGHRSLASTGVYLQVGDAEVNAASALAFA